MIDNCKIQNNEINNIMNPNNDIEIKKEKIMTSVLKLGTKFVRLQITDVVSACGECSELVIPTILDMIEKYQIYAKYFKTTRSIAFDTFANMEILERLNKAYEELER